jgi:catechol 2,3-dioxygenase-like lactoylglutathione lyase family enzyme
VCSKWEKAVELGAFSVSLSVKDINLSKEFYENLGFSVVGGDIEQNWLILRAGGHTIGLFQGMFEHNLLTFNPGWDSDANALEAFTDVRDVQRQLKSRGVGLETEVDENTSGPGSITLVDPDGNAILIDQHV